MFHFIIIELYKLISKIDFFKINKLVGLKCKISTIIEIKDYSRDITKYILIYKKNIFN